MTVIGIDDARIALAPYVWKRTGSGDTARAEATMPGAYLKLDFVGSTAVGLLVDGTANDGCAASACRSLIILWTMARLPPCN